MALPAKIFLIGFSGSGKTTLAPLLAARLHYSLLDTDAEIERIEAMPCSRVINERGLDYFRDRERELLQTVCAAEADRLVVALGGGAPTIVAVVPLIRSAGHVVWLRAGLDEIRARLAGSSDRPLLAGKDRRQLLEFFSAREPIYEAAAHSIVDVDDLNPEQAADRILETLSAGGG